MPPAIPSPPEATDPPPRIASPWLIAAAPVKLPPRAELPNAAPTTGAARKSHRRDDGRSANHAAGDLGGARGVVHLELEPLFSAVQRRETLIELLETGDLMAVCSAVTKRVHGARVDDREVTARRRRTLRLRVTAHLAQELALGALVAADYLMVGSREAARTPGRRCGSGERTPPTVRRSRGGPGQRGAARGRS